MGNSLESGFFYFFPGGSVGFLAAASAASYQAELKQQAHDVASLCQVAKLQDCDLGNIHNGFFGFGFRAKVSRFLISDDSQNINQLIARSSWPRMVVIEDLVGDADYQNGSAHAVDQTSEVAVDNEECVIEEVVHDSPAAELDPSDDVVADEVWARGVAQMISSNIINTSEAETAEPKDDITLLQFNRDPKEFHARLDEGRALESCREALRQAGYQWKLESNAKVFVHPMQYESTTDLLATRNLHSYHVVVAESLEHLVEASLSDVPCRKGARVKKRVALGSGQSQKRARVEDEIDTQHRTHDDIDDDAASQHRVGDDIDDDAPSFNEYEICAIFETKRTFLCRLPRLRRSASVTQSTTEAHGGLNPRRVMNLSLSDN